MCCRDLGLWTYLPPSPLPASHPLLSSPPTQAILEKNDNVNIFISEGAGVKDIVAEMEAQGKEVRGGEGRIGAGMGAGRDWEQ